MENFLATVLDAELMEHKNSTTPNMIDDRVKLKQRPAERSTRKDAS